MKPRMRMVGNRILRFWECEGLGVKVQAVTMIFAYLEWRMRVEK